MTYGLPEEFSARNASQIIKAWDDRSFKIGMYISLFIFIGITVNCIGSIIELTLFEFIMGFLFLGTPTIILVGFGGQIGAIALLRLFQPQSLEGARKFLDDTNVWEYNSKETGAGFWKGLRGIDFERALARMLSSRGVDCRMTRVTGDGGVDLIIQLSGCVYWAQCKGHSTKVSVAAIREIAGACVNSQARPLVFAVNGFTAPAVEAASIRSVKLYDTDDIVRLAQRARIEAI
ncbi:restriction endonuclease [Erythrobacter sp. SDW2]|uniref:restriction endonuclease n=1 Tax=Erythrobacter sp. SDW2 TaxID=2907154 RepID=UPI001F16DA13|nr:restriction endonuclease [Erythrobacter sp. SDW2]UIP07569.1 restriction endonuclease [Erythrobacter sp. SDW2]